MFPLNDIRQIIIIITVTFIFSIFTTFLSRKIAFHINALDIPDKRKVHSKPMPRLGGLGIYTGFLFGYMMFGTISTQMNSILIASFLIILIGIFDDIKPVKATYKLLVQIIASLVVIIYGNVLLDHFTIFGLSIDLGILSYPVTVLFIVGIINAINLIDGLDGLSSGTCLIFFVTVLILMLLKGLYTPVSLCITIVMIGSILGFWIHNFYPAKIFAGDSGSMFMGFMISIVALLGFKTATLTSLIVPIFILAIPIFDTICAIIRRICKKQPIFLPDKHHLHHQLLKMGLSHKNTVLAIYGMNIIFSIISIIYAMYSKTFSKWAYLIAFIIFVIIIARTSIIRDNNKK